MTKKQDKKETLASPTDKNEFLNQKLALISDELENTNVTIDIDGFPSLIKDYIDYIKAQTSCDDISATINILSLISSVVQKSVYIPKQSPSLNKKGYFQKLYPNLWIIEVNKSGGFKTTSQRIAHDPAYKINEIIIKPQQSKSINKST